MRLVEAGTLTIGVYNCAGSSMPSRIAAPTTTGLCAKATGSPKPASSSARDTARASTSRAAYPMSLPAFEAVPMFPVSVREDGVVVVEVPDDA